MQLYARRSVSYPWQSRMSSIPLTQAHCGISCSPSPVVQALIANCNACTSAVHIIVATYYSKRPAVVFPSLSCLPTSLQALKHMLSLASILGSVSISWKESMHATRERDTPAVLFRSCLFSRLLFVLIRWNLDIYTATISWPPSSRSRMPGAYEASSPNCLWPRDYCCFSLRHSGSRRLCVLDSSNGEHSFRKRSTLALVSLHQIAKQGHS